MVKGPVAQLLLCQMACQGPRKGDQVLVAYQVDQGAQVNCQGGQVDCQGGQVDCQGGQVDCQVDQVDRQEDQVACQGGQVDCQEDQVACQGPQEDQVAHQVVLEVQGDQVAQEEACLYKDPSMPHHLYLHQTS